MPTDQPITPEAIAATERLIRPHIRRTPLLSIEAADFGLAGKPLGLKLEFMQHGGTFKARGAFTHMLTRKPPAAGVVAASGGNHGVAVALAAARLGVPASIFLPEVTPEAKRERVRAHGAKLVVGGALYADALAASERFAAESGAMPIHAFDQVETLLGQGTVGLELEQDLPDFDTLLVAVGGGGLIGGIAAWFAGRKRVVAVEPELAPTLHMALAAGEPVDAPAGGVAADSLAPKRVGGLMFEIAKQHVAASVLVTDEAIRAAQKKLWQTVRIVSEPGGAAALAALLSGRYVPAPDERVAVLMCGANTDAVSFG
jgi:threonine dehydratase